MIITISREYGSGGRIIGEKTAETLGFEFYNHNMIDMIAHESGLDRDYIEHWERQVSSPSIWKSFLAGHKGGFNNSFHGEYYCNMGKMFSVQSRIIREAAEKSSCVIVGRCADYILREYRPSLHVLIHADKETRLNRIAGEYKEENAPKALEAVDKGRKSYYAQNTGRVWGDYRGYDLILDSGTLGVDGCAELIVEAAKKKM